MATTTTASAAFIQVVQGDLTTAYQLDNLAFQQNSIPLQQAALDRINRDLALLGQPPAGAPAWYVYPSNFSDVPVLQLPAGVYPPASLTSNLAATIATAAASSPASSPAGAGTGTTTQPPGGGTTTVKGGTGTAKYVSGGAGGGGLGIDWNLYCAEFPDDPVCDFLGPTGGGGGGGGTVDTTTVIVENVGLDQATVSTLLDGALSGLWSTVISGIDAAIAAAIAAVQAALTAIANALKAAYAVLAHLVGDVLSFLKSLFERIIKVIVNSLVKLLQLLGDLYSKILAPLLKWIQLLRQKLLEIYYRFIRPALIIIQYLRSVLAILKAFHIKFAAKLDAWLADLEQRITQPLFYLLSYINAVANWMNLILTAAYLIQKPLWLASLNAYKGSTIGLQINAMSNPIGPAGLATFQQDNQLPTTGQSAAAWLQYTQSGTGPIQPLADQQTQQWFEYLSGEQS